MKGRPPTAEKLSVDRAIAALTNQGARLQFNAAAKDAMLLLPADLETLAAGYAMTNAGIALRALCEHPEPLRIIAEIRKSTREIYGEEAAGELRAMAIASEDIYA